MVKIKNFLLLVCIAGCFAACKKADMGEVYDPTPQFQADTTAIRAFVTENKIPVLKDEQYGIFYQIILPGSGDIVYSAETNVTVDYEGRLLNGTVFDTTSGTAKIFSLGGLIPGWQIGIPKIQKGGKIRLFVPSYYAYGNVELSTPSGVNIPENSPLDFTITLTDALN